MGAIEDALVLFLLLGILAIVFFRVKAPPAHSYSRSKARREANSSALLNALALQEKEFFDVEVEYSSFKISKRTGGSRHLQVPNKT